MKFSRQLLFSLLSSLLLVLSFPRAEIWILAWIGLVPLFFTLDQAKPTRAYLLGYICGLGFFSGTLYWFVHVTVPGAVLLMLYLANYFALFAFAYVLFRQKTLGQKLVLYPSLWVGLEFIRDRFLTGFGWVSLGYSQYRNLPVIQIADITGMLGVSFLIVMVNVLVKELFPTWGQRLRYAKNHVLAVAVIMTVVLVYGAWRLRPLKPLAKLNIALIQGNVAQDVKWDPKAWPGIMQKHLYWTKIAAGQNPDLIVWPETAFPGYVWETPEMFTDLQKNVGEMKTPLLLGLVTRNNGYYNSAVLLSSKGEIARQYDKLHLVPFGEYIPLRKWLPFIEYFLPIEDFSPGREYTLFPAWKNPHTQSPPPLPSGPLEEPDRRGYYSVLICFEDTIAGISREYAKRGAELLINITNDAWFKDTNAPFLHLQGSVFRSVENRRSVLRSANTGVSCFIDPHGRIYEGVSDHKGRQTYIAGYAAAQVGLYGGKTFYTTWGDLFAYICLGCVLGFAFLRIFPPRQPLRR